MSHGRTAGTALTIALTIALAACSSSGPSASGGTPSPSAPDPAQFLQTSAATPGGSATASPGGTGGSRRGATVDQSTASPSPISFPWTSTVPVDAVITPACVRRGGVATITVRTVSRAAVAYDAVYAGTKGGAPPPYGSGYGGNDKGFADVRGNWSNTWVVAPNAPVGPARADVVVTDGREFGYDDPPFAVAGPSGTCG
jgi:hypothetical protein